MARKKTKPIARPVKSSVKQRNEEQLKFLSSRPKDELFWESVSILERYNKVGAYDQSFQSFMDPLVLHASTTPPGTITDVNRVEVHLLRRYEFSMAAPLRFLTGFPDNIDCKEVQIFVNNRWQFLECWLPTLPPSRFSITGPGGYKAQCDWWEIDVWARFKFKDLPNELKDRVLLHAIGERVALQVQHFESHGYLFGQKTSGDELENYFQDVTIPVVPPIQAAVFRLDKTTRERALRVLGEETTQVLPRYNMAASPGRMPLFGRFLHKLELAFTSKGYIEFFQVKIPGFMDRGYLKSNVAVHPVVPAAILKNVPTLQELSISFRSTVDAWSSPWRSISSNGWYSVLDIKRHPCQKILIDWIMVFAFHFIHDIKKVHLTGYVKTETKAKWERMLRDAYQNNSDYVAFIKQEKLNLVQMPDSAFPPICMCPQPCEDLRYRKLSHLRDIAWACLDSPDCRCYSEELQKCECKAVDHSAKGFAKVFREYSFDFDDVAEATNPNLKVESSTI